MKSDSSLDSRSRHPNATQVRRRVSTIIQAGYVTYIDGFTTELAKDRLCILDVVNVLRAGNVATETEGVDGNCHYRIHTERICVTVRFLSDEELLVIAARRTTP